MGQGPDGRYVLILAILCLNRREEKTLLSSLFVCCSKFVEVNQFRGHLVSLF